MSEPGGPSVQSGCEPKHKSLRLPWLWNKLWLLFSQEIKQSEIFIIDKARPCWCSVVPSSTPLCLWSPPSLQAILLVCKKKRGHCPNVWPTYCKLSEAVETIPGVCDRLVLSFLEPNVIKKCCTRRTWWPQAFLNTRISNWVMQSCNQSYLFLLLLSS